MPQYAGLLRSARFLWLLSTRWIIAVLLMTFAVVFSLLMVMVLVRLIARKRFKAFPVLMIVVIRLTFLGFETVPVSLIQMNGRRKRRRMHPVATRPVIIVSRVYIEIHTNTGIVIIIIPIRAGHGWRRSFNDTTTQSCHQQRNHQHF